jgi:murein DD-endopeptidase MepM/ murein hydrolase activator NlpD
VNENQFHTADIRKQVRYFIHSRRTVLRLTVIGAALGLVLLVGLILAPLGIQALLLTSKLHVLAHQHRLHSQILDDRSAALDRLQNRLETARWRQQQLSIVLGAPQEEQGLGGYPGRETVDLTVPEAILAHRRGAKLQADSKALLQLADELVRFARENEELTLSVPSICPVPIGGFVLTSPFGQRLSPFTNTSDFHAGLDLAAREGMPVLATGDGRVVFAGRFPLRRNVRWWRYGNVVVLAHGDRYLTIYAHLAEIAVRRGQRVRRGEQIGTVGNTGWSTSPHLHYEVRVRDEDGGEPVPVDPRIYILDYQWTGHEEMLARSRSAPPPSFDPLPSRVKAR